MFVQFFNIHFVDRFSSSIVVVVVAAVCSDIIIWTCTWNCIGGGADSAG